jgi:homoserine kinase
MEALITYTAGMSYRVQGAKFRRGVPLKVTSAALIRYCQTTAGFTVQITKRPKKKVRKVVRDEAGEPVKTAPAKSSKASKKKTTRRSDDA